MRHTFIEIVVVGIIALTVVGIFVNVGRAITDPNVTIGINGTVENRCLGGYQFVIGQNGKPTQILNEFGKGVPCN